MTKFVTMDRAVSSVFASGSNSCISMMNVFNLVQKRAIYPPSIRRILRFGCSNICEFCYTNKVRFVRPQWGTFSCWECMNNNLGHHDDKTCDEISLNRIWTRCKWIHDDCYEKQYYRAHKVALFAIFNHPRFLAYPYGVRKSYLPNGRSKASSDGYEIVWRERYLSRENENIGPILTYGDIPRLVSHLEKNSSNTIDNYIEDFVSFAPTTWEYGPFSISYERYFKCAQIRYTLQSSERIATKFYNRCLRIQRYIDALEIISRFFTLDLLEHTHNTYPSFVPRPTTNTISALRRVILCYQEEYDTKLKFCVTYDTGDHRLDDKLDRLLRPVMISPSKIISSPSTAKLYASEIYYHCIFSWYLHFYQVPSLFNNGVLRHDFGFTYGLRFRLPRRIYWKVPRVGKTWKDPSHNRRL